MTNTASADEAIADFEASKTLARAREAVQHAKAKHSGEQHVSFDEAIKETEQGWQRATYKIAERVSRTKGCDTRR